MVFASAEVQTAIVLCIETASKRGVAKQVTFGGWVLAPVVAISKPKTDYAVTSLDAKTIA